MTKKPRIYAWNEARPCPGRTKPANGRRATAVASAGMLVSDPLQAPPRHERRRAWALVPRALKPAAPTLDWLPPRTRSLLNRDITRRNDLDRSLATARGLAADAPECARFQGPKYREALDQTARARRRVGLVAPSKAMAVAIAEGAEQRAGA